MGYIVPPVIEKLETSKLWRRHHRTNILETLCGIFFGTPKIKRYFACCYRPLC